MNALFAARFANPAAPSAPAAQRERWMKDGFLNFSLPDGNGGLAKLGSIGLKMDKVRERKLIQWLIEDDGAHMEERCALLVQQLVVEFRSAQPDEAAGFALTQTTAKP